MKPTPKFAIAVSIALVLLLVGAVAFNVLAPPGQLKLKVKWKPVNYILNDPPPNPWIAEIYFAPLRDLNQIDTSTLLLEGMYTPSGTPYLLSGTPPRLAVPFNGADVLRALMSKTPHLAPGEYRISLEISGNLKTEYGGTAFSGTGGINLLVPPISPP